MSDVTIRIWNGRKVVQIVTVGQDGSSSTVGAAGGAENGAMPQIEIDPWAGLIIDHSAASTTPVGFRDLHDRCLTPNEEDED
jgi:hypothetical protein